MSGLFIIRPFTDDDQQRLDASAQRFAARHHLPLDLAGETPTEALDRRIWFSNRQDLATLWQGCRCRALRVPVAADIAVSYGYIGRMV